MLPGVDSAVARSVNPMWLLKCCVIVDLPTIQTVVPVLDRTRWYALKYDR